MNRALDEDLRPLRLGAIMFGLSSILALVVAAFGLYSTMAFMVAWRTREIGVRAALGATGNQIVRLVTTTGGRLAALGAALGIGLDFLAGRWLEPHLFRTSGTDPLVLTCVVALILGVALLAGWIPARRATRVSPVDVLRAE